MFLFVLIFNSVTLVTSAQNNPAAVPPLIRFKEGDNTSFNIPLTNFCFVNNVGLTKNYTNGWIMKWDVTEKANSCLLFMEMNSTDVKGWLGNGDISGSVQLVFELPALTDSLVLTELSANTKGVYLINNYGGVDAKKSYLEGQLKIVRDKANIMVTAAVNLDTRRPATKQQFSFTNQPVASINFSEYQQLANRIDSLQNAEMNSLTNALTTAIIARDSIWKINNKKAQDSLTAHPYTGKFRFWASHIDKAEFSRITYSFDEDSVIIKEGGYDFIYLAKNYTGDVIHYKKALSSNNKKKLAEMGEKLKTDTLKDFYDNRCIMDGLIVSFNFQWPGSEKDVTMSNFYDDKVAAIIDFINNIVPKKYRIWYGKEALLLQQLKCGKNR